jgi:hypothetical protein
MFKKYIIVVLNTPDAALVRFSIPSLIRLKNIYLIINGDITRDAVRKLGWRGKLRIGNDFSKIKSDWLIFMNAGDILINTDIPSVSDEHNAIVGRAATISNLTELGRAMDNPTDFIGDANFDTTGNLIRTEFMLKNIENGFNIRDANPIYMNKTNYIKVKL